MTNQWRLPDEFSSLTNIKKTDKLAHNYYIFYFKASVAFLNRNLVTFVFVNKH